MYFRVPNYTHYLLTLQLVRLSDQRTPALLGTAELDVLDLDVLDFDVQVHDLESSISKSDEAVDCLPHVINSNSNNRSNYLTSKR